MSQATTLTRIGSKVKVNLDRVRDRIPTSLLKLLNNEPRGTVMDYKMTDGQGIGLVIEFSDGTTSWFFDDEISGN